MGGWRSGLCLPMWLIYWLYLWESRRWKIVCIGSLNLRALLGSEWVPSRIVTGRVASKTDFWKGHVWKIGVPKKIKHFLWKSRKNYLACCLNLIYLRGMNMSPECRRCRVTDETISHVLFWVCQVGGILEWLAFYGLCGGNARGLDF